jgi:hypothetical protein
MSQYKKEGQAPCLTFSLAFPTPQTEPPIALIQFDLEEASVSATAVSLVCLRENVALSGKFNGKWVQEVWKGVVSDQST